MQDKHTKIWFVIILATIVNIGAAASYMNQKQIFKGLEPLNSKNIQASVLAEAEEVLPEAHPFEVPKEQIIEASEPPPVPEPQKEQKQAVPSPCKKGETTIVKSGSYVRCRSEKTTAPISPPKEETQKNEAPKVKFIASCESQGKFTYTGPDVPGLLYGMCIECETLVYMANNGQCPKKNLAPPG